MCITHGGTLHRFFAGEIEHVLSVKLGVANPPLIDYVVDTLLRFVRMDAVYKMRTPTGKPLTEVAGMLTEAGARIGSARRAAYRHVGDFTLFWGGMYPEALRELQDAGSQDYFLDYCACGRQAYFLASSMDYCESATDPSSDVLHAMSCNFQLLAYGLREVRRAIETVDAVESYLLFDS